MAPHQTKSRVLVADGEEEGRLLASTLAACVPGCHRLPGPLCTNLQGQLGAGSACRAGAGVQAHDDPGPALPCLVTTTRDGSGLPFPDPPQLVQGARPVPAHELQPTSPSVHREHMQGTRFAPLQVGQGEEGGAMAAS